MEVSKSEKISLRALVSIFADLIIIIINNLFTVGVINERLIAIKKLIKANYL